MRKLRQTLLKSTAYRIRTHITIHICYYCVVSDTLGVLWFLSLSYACHSKITYPHAVALYIFRFHYWKSQPNVDWKYFWEETAFLFNICILIFSLITLKQKDFSIFRSSWNQSMIDTWGGGVIHEIPRWIYQTKKNIRYYVVCKPLISIPERQRQAQADLCKFWVQGQLGIQKIPGQVVYIATQRHTDTHRHRHIDTQTLQIINKV